MIQRFFGSRAKPAHPAQPVGVTLWGKADCCLCDRAKAVLERLSRDYPLQVTYRDITADPIAFERYQYVIPVVEFANGKRFEGKITEHWLRRALDEGSAGRPS